MNIELNAQEVQFLEDWLRLEIESYNSNTSVKVMEGLLTKLTNNE